MPLDFKLLGWGNQPDGRAMVWYHSPYEESSSSSFNGRHESRLRFQSRIQSRATSFFGQAISGGGSRRRERPPCLSAFAITIHNILVSKVSHSAMGFLHLFIVNKSGGLILHRPLSPKAPRLGTNEWLRIGSTFHSLHAIAAEACPVRLPGGKNESKKQNDKNPPSVDCVMEVFYVLPHQFFLCTIPLPPHTSRSGRRH